MASTMRDARKDQPVQDPSQVYEYLKSYLLANSKSSKLRSLPWRFAWGGYTTKAFPPAQSAEGRTKVLRSSVRGVQPGTAIWYDLEVKDGEVHVVCALEYLH